MTKFVHTVFHRSYLLNFKSFFCYAYLWILCVNNVKFQLICCEEFDKDIQDLAVVFLVQILIREHVSRSQHHQLPFVHLTYIKKNERATPK